MIRVLLLLLVFVLGLATAAVWQGEMHHLRRIVPERLPEWTTAIADDAGARRGRMTLAPQGRLPAAELIWVAKRPSADGFLWDLSLTGRGFELRAEALVPFWPGKIILRGGGGAVDLAEVSGQQVSGLIALRGIDGQITDLLGARPISGTIEAEARNITVETAKLGSGPINGSLSEDGTWQADIAATGGISDIEGQVSGALGAVLAQLDVLIANVAALPEDARTAIAPWGTPEADGLRLRLPVPLRD